MLVSTQYPSRVTAIVAGKRSPETFLLWQRAELEIPEREAPLQSAVHLKMKRGTTVLEYHRDAGINRDNDELITHDYYHLDAPGLVQPVAVAHELAEGRLDRSAYHEVFGMELRAEAEVMADMPRIRQLIEDKGAQENADLVRAAARTVIIAGQVIAPVLEPYIHIGLINGDRYSEFSISFATPTQLDGYYNCFRISDFQSALDFCRAHGATADDIAIIEDAFEIEVTAPDMLTFDPLAAGLVKAAEQIKQANKDILYRLTAEQLAAWAQLRDAIEPFCRDPARDVVEFGQKLKTAQLLLRNAGTQERYQYNRQIDIEIERLDAQWSEIDQDLDALASPGL